MAVERGMLPREIHSPLCRLCFGSIHLVWALPRGIISVLVETLTTEFHEKSGIDAVYIDGIELHDLPESVVFTGEN